MSDFSDRPLVAGSLIGARAFDVDKLGRLVGPTYPAVFTPGENIAKCKAGGSGFLLYQQALMRSLSMPLYKYNVSEGQVTATRSESSNEADATPEEPKHQVGNTNCVCGFYAYFDGKSDYSQPGRVTALVEGYGVCTVGTRGFRAEKARLVALIDPAARSSWSLLGDWRVSLFLAALNALLSIKHLMKHDWIFLGISLAAVALLSTSAYFDHKRQALRSPAAFDLVRRNYPDVPVYRSLRAATAERPLTPPEPPRRPSPDDEDFWTRAATS